MLKRKWRVRYTLAFGKKFKRIPLKVRRKALRKEKILMEDPFNPSLRTHKLSGKLKNYWSFSVDYQYRIVFRFLGEGGPPEVEARVVLVDIGTHEIYR